MAELLFRLDEPEGLAVGKTTRRTEWLPCPHPYTVFTGNEASEDDADASPALAETLGGIVRTRVENSLAAIAIAFRLRSGCAEDQSPSTR